jgi:hypothetical protein
MASLRALPSSISAWRSASAELALHGGGHFVAAAALVLQRLYGGGALVGEADDQVGVGVHVAVGDVGAHRFDIVPNKFKSSIVTGILEQKSPLRQAERAA